MCVSWFNKNSAIEKHWDQPNSFPVISFLIKALVLLHSILATLPVTWPTNLCMLEVTLTECEYQRRSRMF